MLGDNKEKEIKFEEKRRIKAYFRNTWNDSEDLMHCIMKNLLSFLLFFFNGSDVILPFLIQQFHNNFTLRTYQLWNNWITSVPVSPGGTRKNIFKGPPTWINYSFSSYNMNWYRFLLWKSNYSIFKHLRLQIVLNNQSSCILL